MKNLLLVSTLFLVSEEVFAQCNTYFQLEEGMNWAYESYNSKDKLTGRNEMSITDLSSTDDGYVATVNSVIYDDKGKELSNGDLEYTCKSGVVYVDMRRFVPQQQLGAMGAYEMEVTADNLELPSELKEGQTLKEGSITISASNSPIPMNITVTITDRVVESAESITVPAGTFDCIKIKSKSKMNMKMGMSINNEFSSVQWYAEGIGMIKSETYDDKGILTGYSVLAEK